MDTYWGNETNLHLFAYLARQTNALGTRCFACPVFPGTPSEPELPAPEKGDRKAIKKIATVLMQALASGPPHDQRAV